MRFRDATITTRIQLPVIRAAMALRRNEPSRALQLLEPVSAYDDAPAAEFWPTYLRGEAWLQLKNGARAGEQFRRVLSHRGAAPGSPLFPLAQVGVARAAVLAGDDAAAKAAFAQFFAVWKEADDIRPVADARRESLRFQ